MGNITIPLDTLLEVQEVAVSLYEDFCAREKVAWDKWYLRNPQPLRCNTTQWLIWSSEHMVRFRGGIIPCAPEESLGSFLKDFSPAGSDWVTIEITPEQFKAYQNLKGKI